MLQEAFGCGGGVPSVPSVSGTSETAEAKTASGKQLFDASARPLLVSPDLRLVVSGVPQESAGVPAGQTVRASEARIYSRVDFNYRLKSYLVQICGARPDVLEALGLRWGANPADPSADGVKRLLHRVLCAVLTLPAGELLELLGELPECAGLRQPLLDYLSKTQAQNSAKGTNSGALGADQPIRRPKPFSDTAGQESRAHQRQLLQ